MSFWSSQWRMRILTSFLAAYTCLLGIWLFHIEIQKFITFRFHTPVVRRRRRRLRRLSVIFVSIFLLLDNIKSSNHFGLLPWERRRDWRLGEYDGWLFSLGSPRRRQKPSSWFASFDRGVLVAFPRHGMVKDPHSCSCRLLLLLLKVRDRSDLPVTAVSKTISFLADAQASFNICSILILPSMSFDKLEKLVWSCSQGSVQTNDPEVYDPWCGLPTCRALDY